MPRRRKRNADAAIHQQEQTRQNLLRVGVLAAPAEALDDAGFELGLQLVVKGAGTFREFA